MPFEQSCSQVGPGRFWTQLGLDLPASDGGAEELETDRRKNWSIRFQVMVSVSQAGSIAGIKKGIEICKKELPESGKFCWKLENIAGNWKKLVGNWIFFNEICIFFGQKLLEFGRIWLNPTKSSQIWSRSRQIWPRSHRIWLVFVGFGRIFLQLRSSSGCSGFGDANPPFDLLVSVFENGNSPATDWTFGLGQNQVGVRWFGWVFGLWSGLDSPTFELVFNKRHQRSTTS